MKTAFAVLGILMAIWFGLELIATVMQQRGFNPFM